MKSEEVKRLKGYMLDALKNLWFNSGTKLEWQGKLLAVFQDKDGFFWMDGKCFDMHTAVDYAAKHFGIVESQFVYVVVKEYDHGSCPVGVFLKEKHAYDFRARVVEEPGVIACHVTMMEVQ